MINRWRLLCAALTLLLLSACAGQQPGTSISGSIPEKASLSPVTATDLPCSEIDRVDALQVSYPAESLYRSGAALPSQQGLVCLDALADWLKTVTRTPLLITVSGKEGFEFDALALAAKRQELLKRYLTRRGINAESWQWATEKDAGFQLQITETKR